MVRPTEEFVRRHTFEATLRDGGRILVRPITPDDRDRIAAGFRRLTPASRYRRFFSPISELTPAVLTYLTEIDYHDHFAWGAVDLDDPGRPGIGVARYVRLHADPAAAEVAVAVMDDHHGRGIATILLEAVAMTAREHGIERLVAVMLPDNAAMKKVFADLNAELSWDAHEGLPRADLPVPASPADLEDSALYETLRAAARGEIEIHPPG